MKVGESTDTPSACYGVVHLTEVLMPEQNLLMQKLRDFVPLLEVLVTRNFFCSEFLKFMDRNLMVLRVIQIYHPKYFDRVTRSALRTIENLLLYSDGVVEVVCYKGNVQFMSMELK